MYLNRFMLSNKGAFIIYLVGAMGVLGFEKKCYLVAHPLKPNMFSVTLSLFNSEKQFTV
jgi:hypothetical protein